MNASELSGAELDAAVAQALGFEWRVQGRWCIAEDSGFPFRPSSVWADGGPIIERELEPIDDNGAGGLWRAQSVWKCQLKRGGWVCDGPTPLIAAMRAFVADKQERPE
jgi:hypothetical protein